MALTFQFSFHSDSSFWIFCLRDKPSRALGGKAGHKSAISLLTTQSQDETGKHEAWSGLWMTLGEFIQRAEGLTRQVASGSWYGFQPHPAGGRGSLKRIM